MGLVGKNGARQSNRLSRMCEEKYFPIARTPGKKTLEGEVVPLACLAVSLNWRPVILQNPGFQIRTIQEALEKRTEFTRKRGSRSLPGEDQPKTKHADTRKTVLILHGSPGTFGKSDHVGFIAENHRSGIRNVVSPGDRTMAGQTAPVEDRLGLVPNADVVIAVVAKDDPVPFRRNAFHAVGRMNVPVQRRLLVDIGAEDAHGVDGIYLTPEDPETIAIVKAAIGRLVDGMFLEDQ